MSSLDVSTTTLSYDFADRPVQTTKPNGAWSSVSYWDNLLRQTTNAKFDVVNGTEQIVASFQDFDGAGRVIRKGSDHPNALAGKYSGQKFKYDELGRGVEQTNIHGVDSSFTLNDGATVWEWTHANFDGIGRSLTRIAGYNWNGARRRIRTRRNSRAMNAIRWYQITIRE